MGESAGIAQEVKKDLGDACDVGIRLMWIGRQLDIKLGLFGGIGTESLTDGMWQQSAPDVSSSIGQNRLLSETARSTRNYLEGDVGVGDRQLELANPARGACARRRE